MRHLSPDIEAKISQKHQTISENANPYIDLKIMRPVIPLVYPQFLERQRIVKITGLSDCSIAVKHTKYAKEDEEIWVAYVQNGKLKIRYGTNNEVMKNIAWNEYVLNRDASACAIAFDSVCKRGYQDEYEFLTGEYPWVFWVEDGALMAKMCTPLGIMIYTLAESNVTDVSAVRGCSGEDGMWDFGLTVFFLANGHLYYKQLIDGTWYDAELVQELPSGTIAKIAAFNTWDYRVGVQVLTSSGDLYEIYSYTEGIGTRNIEHLSMDLSADAQLKQIAFSEGYLNEHIELGITLQADRIYGLSAVPVSAENINADGNWGTKVRIVMDYPVTEGDYSEFLLVDSNGVRYAPVGLEVDGTEIVAEFIDFNLAAKASTISVRYTKGTLMSPVVVTESFNVTFTPTNLVAPTEDPPAIVSMHNL